MYVPVDVGVREKAEFSVISQHSCLQVTETQSSLNKTSRRILTPVTKTRKDKKEASWLHCQQHKTVYQYILVCSVSLSSILLLFLDAPSFNR